MDNKGNTIRTAVELEARLTELRALRDSRQGEIVSGATAIYQTIIHPAPLIKRCVRALAADRDFRGDLLRLATHWLTRFFTRSKIREHTGGEGVADDLLGLLGNSRK